MKSCIVQIIIAFICGIYVASSRPSLIFGCSSAMYTTTVVFSLALKIYDDANGIERRTIARNIINNVEIHRDRAGVE